MHDRRLNVFWPSTDSLNVTVLILAICRELKEKTYVRDVNSNMCLGTYPSLPDYCTLIELEDRLGDTFGRDSDMLGRAGGGP